MKSLYQRRTDGDYKGYTKDSFYFNSTEQLWCWKQSSKNIIHKASTIEELKKIKNKELVGQGNYDHKNDSTLEQGHTSTEEFAKITEIGSKEYVSMLLKRGITPMKVYDKNSGGQGVHRPENRRKKGLHFIYCLKKTNIKFSRIRNKFNTKVWVFENLNDEKISNFKKYWKEK